MERGIIAAPSIIEPLPEGFVIVRDISPEELRYYILYWDKVVIPSNNLVQMGVPEEVELLRSGAIERPKVVFQGSFSGNDTTDAILSCQSIVASELVKKKDIDWVIHQIGKKTVFPESFSANKQVVRVQLINSLPVPDGSTPIDDILEFKEKRKSELTTLHETLDAIYFDILNSPDIDLSTKKSISNFQQSLFDLEKVSKEQFKKSRKYDFSVDLSINGKDIAIGAASGAVLDFYANPLNIPIATVVGSLASILKVCAKASKTFEPAQENSKLAYLSNAREENIIT